MLIGAYFTESGAPKGGLTPVLDIWNSAGTHLIIAQTMTEVAAGDVSGWYYYDYLTYEDDLNYFMRADGGVGLTNSERYVFNVNELGFANFTIDNVSTAVNNHRTATENNIKYILGLVQSNFRMYDQTYNAGGDLVTASIRTYPTAEDVDADTNTIKEYSVTSVYGGDGKLQSYKVKEV